MVSLSTSKFPTYLNLPSFHTDTKSIRDVIAFPMDDTFAYVYIYIHTYLFLCIYIYMYVCVYCNHRPPSNIFLPYTPMPRVVRRTRVSNSHLSRWWRARSGKSGKCLSMVLSRMEYIFAYSYCHLPVDISTKKTPFIECIIPFITTYNW